MELYVCHECLLFSDSIKAGVSLLVALVSRDKEFRGLKLGARDCACMIHILLLDAVICVEA